MGEEGGILLNFDGEGRPIKIEDTLVVLEDFGHVVLSLLFKCVWKSFKRFREYN